MLESLLALLPERIQPSPRFVRFLLVGVINTAFGYTIFVICLWLGMHYALAAAVATVLGVLFNFQSTGRLVFKSQNHRLLPKFIRVYVVVYMANVVGLAGLDQLGVPSWVGGGLLILPCAVLSYFLNKRHVFYP